MGINVHLQNETGHTQKECLDPHRLLAKALRGYSDLSTTMCLRFIDPYGDTTFNRQQAHELVAEFGSLRATVDLGTRLLLDQVIALCEEVKAGVHLYLKFVGD